MYILNIVADIFLVFLFSVNILFITRKLAKKFGLVDEPNHRKKHHGEIPLVGGIVIFFSINLAFIITNEYIPRKWLYLFCAGILVFIGILDDRFDISVKFRAIIQVIITFIMIFFAELKLNNLGYALGPYQITLGYLSYFTTLFAVLGIVNAFNMIDGIDGLLGGVSCVSFTSLGILFYQNGNMALTFWCFSVIAAIIPYIFLNLGLLGSRYKVFMGDSGSTLIGFTIIWLLLMSTQDAKYTIKPVTALWTIAIPLMDMITTMYRRLRKGISPFSPDRQHIHHLIMRSGFTENQALILITLAATILAAIGMLGEQSKFIPEWIMFMLFIFTFFIYVYVIKRIWKIAHFIKKLNIVAKHNQNKY
ncbi:MULTISPECIES: UDP-N-acetylglucosamine--undecaprenyl-phosphate N-acetylglucosaminephosphotransferase [Arsenophonus]|uniref:UDP-N-acetylglucosamine--undecaprenyl-phosphate N-acetylglucosaminephosphotransferase n=1 Tax=Arsenophonus TaxID=637 RepID=UPI000829646C|nr:UDP-N-acetylglucosamine--undecaprenyl-phosphate N-acetylglucosaminephosphotransferase [Candidatus Arsenophonus lipoptenae]